MFDFFSPYNVPNIPSPDCSTFGLTKPKQITPGQTNRDEDTRAHDIQYAQDIPGYAKTGPDCQAQAMAGHKRVLQAISGHFNCHPAICTRKCLGVW